MTNLNNIIEILAKQAMGGQQQSNQQSGLGGDFGFGAWATRSG